MAEFASVFAPLEQKQDLQSGEAEALMSFLMGGEGSDQEILAILNAMCDKGPTETELVAFARVMKDRASVLRHSFPRLVDTCGTGGGKATFNISTSAAVVAAAAGVKVAKHGNRSSSGIGSADVLEELGVKLGGSHDHLNRLLDEVGIAFLFAPAHHPAMKYVASARRQLGRRSFFNLLGPLANPAGATRQSIGVYDSAYLSMMAHAANRLGAERLVVVHSHDGLDEISPCAPTDAVILSHGASSFAILEPSQFGIDPVDFEEIVPGSDPKDAAKLFLEAISDPESPRGRAIIPSAAVAIWLADLAPDFAAAAGRARDAIADGMARRKLQELVAASCLETTTA